jgi:hypothetical protein
MMKDWIYNKMIKKRNEKRHEVLKLQWQKAELEKVIADAKQREIKS